ncbi:hypothetical protein DM01DRAFT_21974 [Hesseltinella vesiculosa]|uniref:Uncharacterized protein n=1 Tax=Hesseltinella vesiculosa TaxID=101127 RepID=A0A1X2GT97_9FUNG|nr:hypothetical protein DM01DRAFT_21974 [Hesseltinella vesiculosa]
MVADLCDDFDDAHRRAKKRRIKEQLIHTRQAVLQACEYFANCPTMGDQATLDKIYNVLEDADIKMSNMDYGDFQLNKSLINIRPELWLTLMFRILRLFESFNQDTAARLSDQPASSVTMVWAHQVAADIPGWSELGRHRRHNIANTLCTVINQPGVAFDHSRLPYLSGDAIEQLQHLIHDTRAQIANTNAYLQDNKSVPLTQCFFPACSTRFKHTKSFSLCPQSTLTRKYICLNKVTLAALFASARIPMPGGVKIDRVFNLKSVSRAK